MPCYDGRDSIHGYESENRELSKEIDRLTALLCHACGQLTFGTLDKFPELRSWWDEHQVKDEARRKADDEASREVAREEYLESVRARLRDQLTGEEKEAVGLK